MGVLLASTLRANLVDFATLEPGVYAATGVAAPHDAPLDVLEVPNGFSSFKGAGVIGPEGPVRGLGYWTVTGVLENPCTEAGGAPDPGPSFDNFADALQVRRAGLS